MWDTVCVNNKPNEVSSTKPTGLKFPTSISNVVEQRIATTDVDETLFRDAKDYIFQVMASSLMPGYRQQEGNLLEELQFSLTAGFQSCAIV